MALGGCIWGDGLRGVPYLGTITGGRASRNAFPRSRFAMLPQDKHAARAGQRQHFLDRSTLRCDRDSDVTGVAESMRGCSFQWNSLRKTKEKTVANVVPD